MNGVNISGAVDEMDLEDELEQLQQEQLDEQMLKTGSVPVSDAVQRMPAAANGERKRDPLIYATRKQWFADCIMRSPQLQGCNRGRRRRGRTSQAPGRDEYVLVFSHHPSPGSKGVLHANSSTFP